MRKIVVFLLGVFLLLHCAACSDTAFAPFTKLASGNIVDASGTEYVFLAFEGRVVSLGRQTFAGRVNGEKESFRHLASRIQTGMFSCEGDPEKRILIRNVPDCEFQAYYRKAALPPLDLSPEHCIRLELLKGSLPDKAAHRTCDGGLNGKDQIAAFLTEIRSQQTAEAAGLYKQVRRSDGSLENCYRYGVVYGFLAEEPNIAIPLYVTSYNDIAYSIALGETEYVLPAEWLAALEHTNAG